MNNLIRNINTNTGAAKLSLAVIISLIVLKLIVSVISRSISISAQAADSLLDLFSISITLIAVKMSGIPADQQHPFGHGKLEGLAALIQSIMILAAGSVIIYSAVQRIITSVPIQAEEGILVMVVSIIASYFLSRHLRKVASSTGSLAIEASARNIRTDVYSAAGVLLGLLIVKITGFTILDPIIALIMAVLVVKAGVEVLVKAFRELADSELPKEDQRILTECISEYNNRLVNFHAMRSRRSGSDRFIDLHLMLPRDLSIEESHRLCDHIESDIRKNLPNTDITIHVEPCNDAECPRCMVTGCRLRKP